MVALPSPNRDLVAPLGIAFTDGFGGTVLDGLSVRAWPDGHEAATVTAVINGVGIAGFLRLPGVEINPVAPFSGTKRTFVVEVRDSAGRFQTGRVQTLAPTKGVASVMLYSAPARTVSPSQLTFRAELWDAVNNRPATFAVLTIKLADNGGATIATGLTDGMGRMLAIGDWPMPKAPSATNGTGHWDDPRAIVVTAQYNPVAQLSVPQLDLLADLPAARLWDTRGPDTLFAPPSIKPATSVVLRSMGDKQGRLLITSP